MGFAEDKENICGFWGLTCSSTLEETSRGKGKKFFAKIESLCLYKCDYGKVPSKPSRENPCTNRLIHCSIKECKKVVRSYNMSHHFSKVRPDNICNVFITERDVTAMKKAYKNTNWTIDLEPTSICLCYIQICYNSNKSRFKVCLRKSVYTFNF